MSDPLRNSSFPRAPLVGAAALILLSLAAVAIARVLDLSRSHDVTLEGVRAQTVRDLRFFDGADGSVAVVAAESQELLTRFPAGEGGFVRATLRALARERRLHGLGDDLPFRVTLTDAGDVILSDPAVDRHLDLRAFGVTNAQAFARLLTLPPASGAAETTRVATTETQTWE